MVVAMTMAVVAVVMMMTAEDRAVRHNDDLAHLMDVPVVVNMLANHLLVKVERVRSAAGAKPTANVSAATAASSDLVNI